MRQKRITLQKGEWLFLPISKDRGLRAKYTDEVPNDSEEINTVVADESEIPQDEQESNCDCEENIVSTEETVEITDESLENTNKIEKENDEKVPEVEIINFNDGLQE